MSDKPAVRLLKTIDSLWWATPVGEDAMEQAIAVQGMMPLRTWAIDLDRRLDQVERDVDEAAKRGLPDGLDQAESALWRLSAGRNSMLALCFLTLGVPTLEPAHMHEGGRVKRDDLMKSLQWEPRRRRVDRRLAELSSIQAAGDLNRLLLDLSEHPAITLRDEITHSLAPLKEAPPLCLFELLEVDGDKLTRPPALRFLWPRRMNEKPGITRNELWPDALAQIRDAHRILVEAVEKLTQLLPSVGIARRPQQLYRNVRTGEVTVTDPR